MSTLGQQTIGAIVTLRENGVPQNYIVVQQADPGGAYQGFSGRTVLLRQRVLPNRFWSNPFIIQNDYQNSALHAWLNGEFLNSLDSDIRNQLTQVRIPFRPGSGTSQTVSSGVNGLLAQVFCLSLTEVGWQQGVFENMPFAEGVRFAFFQDGTGTTANNQRIGLNDSGAATQWWLRSPSTYSTSSAGRSAWLVGLDGASINVTNLSGATRGVRPALTLPSSLFVSNTNDIWVNHPPTTPPAITVPATIVAGNAFNISWTEATDPNNTPQALTYTLQRSLDDGAWTQIFNGTALQFSDTVPTGTTSAAYRVLARNTSGHGSDWRTGPTRTVINNQDPVISGADISLGQQTGEFAHNYTVTDPDIGDTITVTETLNGVQLRPPFTAISGESQTLAVDFEQFLALGNGTHTLVITATDQHGGTDTRTLTFSREESGLEITLSESRPANDMPRRAAITVGRQIADGALFLVEVCNNAYDASPTWEDCTQAVLDMAIYLFQNTTNTAGQWGVNVHVKADRNGADGDIWVSSIGGAFDSIVLTNG